MRNSENEQGYSLFIAPVVSVESLAKCFHVWFSKHNSLSNVLPNDVLLVMFGQFLEEIIYVVQTFASDAILPSDWAHFSQYPVVHSCWKECCVLPFRKK